MNNEKQNKTFLLLLLSAALVLVFFIIEPFLIALIMAGIFAFLFQPVYKKFTIWMKGRSSLSAFVVAFLTVIIVIVLVSLIGIKLAKETSSLYQVLSSGNAGIIEQVENILTRVKSSLPFLENFEFDFRKYASQALQVITQNIGSIFSSFATIILNLFLFLIAFYFLLKDGDKFSKYLIKLSPLDDKDDLFIIKRLKSAVQATVKGSLTIGLIQGILTGVGFAIFGVPNPVLWGSITAIAALIPGIGTSLVIIPALIYLFVSGDIWNGIGLSIWGVTAVGLVDNFLGPQLIGKGMKLHPLAIFVSVLGGMALFGPLGFIFGPLALSICMALIDVYLSLRK